MSETDKIKEKIGYFKFWLGIFVASDLATLTWLIQNYNHTEAHLVATSIVVILLLSFGVFKTHKSISNKINELEGL